MYSLVTVLFALYSLPRDISEGETVVNRNLGFEKTEHLIFCPLCKHLILAVKVEGMFGSYERCSNCLIGFETEAWIYAFRMILSNLDSKGGQYRKMEKVRLNEF
jgi:hypothetical protein